MRTRCATGLRHSPTTGCQRSKRSGYARQHEVVICRRPPPRSGRRRQRSVADSPDRGVGVLVVELVAETAGDVDDLGSWLRMAVGPRRTLALAGGSGGERLIAPHGDLLAPGGHL